ncbi:MAG: hypothetical protein GY832_06155 [Chloroflexi bacterium]|nr:hypothetical protein [Chloroflexota bacterium]
MTGHQSRGCSKNITEMQRSPIVYPGSPIGESTQAEDGQANVESHLLVDGGVVRSLAVSPRSAQVVSLACFLGPGAVGCGVCDHKRGGSLLMG